MSSGTARRLLSGSALRVTYVLCSVLVSFYMYPFLVHALGDRWYGFWSIAGSIVGYYAMLDLGLTPAAHRFLAIAHSRGDQRDTNEVFNTALGLFTAGGVIALAITGIAWSVLPRFVIPAELDAVRLLVLLLGVNFALAFPVAVFNGILAANIRYDLSSYLQLGKLVGRTALVVAVMRHSSSIVALAWITLTAETITNVFTVVFAVRLWPWLRLSPRLFNRARIKEFFGYGVFSFFIRLGDLVRWGVDNLMVGGFVGVAMVTHYGIAMRLTDNFQDIFFQAISVLTPVFARYHATDDKLAMFSAVRQSSRLAVAFAVSAAGAAIIFGEFFIRRWMGPRYVDAYIPLIILIVAALISIMQLASLAYLYAIARHKYYAALNGADALANFGFSLLLAPRFGMIGVAIGTLIPTVIVKLVLQPRYVCRQLGYSFGAYWKELGTVFVMSAALQIPIAIVVRLAQPSGYASIFTLAALLYSIDGVLLYLFVLWPEDRDVLSRALPPLTVLTAMRQRVAAAVSGESQ